MNRDKNHLFSFPAAEKKQNAAAAYAASNVSAWDRVVCTAPSKAEERLLKGAANVV